MVAVVCLTGSSGTSAQRTTPAMPATTATRRAMAERRVRSGSSRGTRLDGRRRTYVRLMAQRCGAPQTAARGRTELESCRLGVAVVGRELLQLTPVAEPVVLQIGGQGGGPQQQLADAERSAADVV